MQRAVRDGRRQPDPTRTAARSRGTLVVDDWKCRNNRRVLKKNGPDTHTDPALALYTLVDA